LHLKRSKIVEDVVLADDYTKGEVTDGCAGAAAIVIVTILLLITGCGRCNI
jgi:hypothetical protein